MSMWRVINNAMIKKIAGLAALGLLIGCAPTSRVDTGDLAAEEGTTPLARRFVFPERELYSLSTGR